MRETGQKKKNPGEYREKMRWHSKNEYKKDCVQSVVMVTAQLRGI